MADPPYRVLLDGSQLQAEWEALARRVLPAALATLRRRGQAPAAAEVSVLLVDDAEIHDLNRRYRGIDAPTDVLSFGQLEGDGPAERHLPPDYVVPLGDLVISLPRMRAQAVEYGHTETRELGYLLVHGLLHLLGFDHELPDQALAMRAAEEELLAAAGLTREPAAE